MAFEHAVEQAQARMASPWPGLSGIRRRGFKARLETVRSLLWWREEMRMHSTRMYAIVRHWVLEAGRRMQAEGHLDAAEDIFFLDLRRFVELLDGQLQPERLRGLVRAARLYYDGFRDFRNPDEIGSRWLGVSAATPAADGSLEGIGGSAGIYRGRARVLASVEEVGRLEPGDVLVTRFTDPGWTSAFAGLGAVVTETGGVLSHAAVISREYGFPAVLAVSAATTSIQDGEWVEVNGDAGRVTPLGMEPPTP